MPQDRKIDFTKDLTEKQLQTKFGDDKTQKEKFKRSERKINELITGRTQKSKKK